MGVWRDEWNVIRLAEVVAQAERMSDLEFLERRKGPETARNS